MLQYFVENEPRTRLFKLVKLSLQLVFSLTKIKQAASLLKPRKLKVPRPDFRYPASRYCGNAGSM